MAFSFQNSSFKDPDTGVYNLNYFMEILFREWHRLMRDNERLSLVLIHPSYNSHEHVNEAKAVASILDQSTYRASDLVSKLNKDDFLLGLFSLNKQGTDVIVDRILQQSNLLKAKYGVEIWASGINLCPNSQINLERVFDDLQILLNSPEINNEQHYKIQEYIAH